MYCQPTGCMITLQRFCVQFIQQSTPNNATGWLCSQRRDLLKSICTVAGEEHLSLALLQQDFGTCEVTADMGSLIMDQSQC